MPFVCGFAGALPAGSRPVLRVTAFSGELIFIEVTIMRKKSTQDLMTELQNSECDIETYLSSNESDFVFADVKQFWENAVKKSGLSKSNIINRADFSYCYFYDVINGRKLPGRDKILRLVLSMHMSVEDCQQALWLCGKSALYPRVKRDSVLLYAINNGYSVYQTNELLHRNGEENLK